MTINLIILTFIGYFDCFKSPKLILTLNLFPCHLFPFCPLVAATNMFRIQIVFIKNINNDEISIAKVSHSELV